jgi:hypothetical protein
VAVVASLALTISFAVPALAEKDRFKARMDSDQEAPVCVSDATGKFDATISDDETTVSYTLSYDLTPGATVQQAHIHIGQMGVSGGITVWLCQSGGTFIDPTGLAPTCVATPGTVTGTFTKANVVGPAAQGIVGGAGGATDEEFAQLLGAIRAKHTYANVHSNICPGGEARGQLK